MKRNLSIAPLMVVLLLGAQLPALGDGKPVSPETFRAFRVFYDYDKQLPLDVQVIDEQQVPASENEPAHRRITLSFMNNRDERIPAYDLDSRKPRTRSLQFFPARTRRQQEQRRSIRC